jgi:hypothetical protein
VTGGFTWRQCGGFGADKAVLGSAAASRAGNLEPFSRGRTTPDARIRLKKIEGLSREKSNESMKYRNFLEPHSLGELTMHYLQELKKWLGEITEIALLLVALGIVVEILFGEAVPFFGGIVANLTRLLSVLGENGLVGLIALAIILFLFYRKKAVA